MHKNNRWILVEGSSLRRSCRGLFLLIKSVALTLWLSGCLGYRGSDAGLQRGLDRVVEEAEITSDSREDALSPAARAASFNTLRLALFPESVLALGLEANRDLQRDRERLAATLLSSQAASRAVGILPTGEGRFSRRLSGEENSADEQGEIVVALGDTWASGATVRLSARNQIDLDPEAASREAGENEDGFSESEEYRTTLSARVSQPLWVGAGYEASHGASIQARRDLVYALRAFELRRQDFAIELLSGYFDLVSRKSALANTRLNLEQASFLRRRSEAMFRVQLAPYIDVLRSQQQELASRQRVITNETALDSATRRYLVTLGRDPATPTDLNEVVPPLRPLLAQLDDCTMQALELRLDLRSAEGAVEDARRALRVARQAMGVDASLFTEASSRTTEAGDFPGKDFEDRVIAGVEFELPLDRRDQRDALRRAQWVLDQAERGLQEQRDLIVVQILENFNRLRTQQSNVDIEASNVEIARRRVQNAVFRFRSGQLSNRDVVEAEDALLQARNALVRALIDHEVERLILLRNMGGMRVSGAGALEESEAVIALFGPAIPMDSMVDPPGVNEDEETP